MGHGRRGSAERWPKVPAVCKQLLLVGLCVNGKAYSRDALVASKTMRIGAFRGFLKMASGLHKGEWVRKSHLSSQRQASDKNEQFS
jgi:hypothetical protein